MELLVYGSITEQETSAVIWNGWQVQNKFDVKIERSTCKDHYSYNFKGWVSSVPYNLGNHRVLLLKLR